MTSKIYLLTRFVNSDAILTSKDVADQLQRSYNTTSHASQTQPIWTVNCVEYVRREAVTNALNEVFSVSFSSDVERLFCFAADVLLLADDKLRLILEQTQLFTKRQDINISGKTFEFGDMVVRVCDIGTGSTKGVVVQLTYRPIDNSIQKCIPLMTEFMSALSDFEILDAAFESSLSLAKAVSATDEEALARQYIAMLTNNKVSIFR